MVIVTGKRSYGRGDQDGGILNAGRRIATRCGWVLGWWAKGVVDRYCVSNRPAGQDLCLSFDSFCV